MSFDIAPRQYARYRSTEGRCVDMRHYDDDQATWADARGVAWVRTALTERRYTLETRAQEELDRIEKETTNA